MTLPPQSEWYPVVSKGGVGGTQRMGHQRLQHTLVAPRFPGSSQLGCRSHQLDTPFLCLPPRFRLSVSTSLSLSSLSNLPLSLVSPTPCYSGSLSPHDWGSTRPPGTRGEVPSWDGGRGSRLGGRRWVTVLGTALRVTDGYRPVGWSGAGGKGVEVDPPGD